MNKFKIKKLAGIFLIASVVLLSSCGTKKEMSLAEFLDIEIEFLESDLSEESKKSIVENYGFTADQFDELSKKVEENVSLQEELGKIRLQKSFGK